MFGTWISDVQRALSARFPAERAYNAEDLKSPQMPPAVGHFLGHALKRRAARIEFSVESEWFDADASDVRSALESYRKALTATARYPQSAWESSLERGVQFVVTFIADPATGLVSFVFGDSDKPLPVGRIRERLGYFGTNQALREIIVGYLDGKGLAEMSPEDLRALVLKGDRSLVVDFEANDWAEHLAPLYEIAAVACEDENADVSIPTGLLKGFFAAKDSEEIVRRLEALESVKGEYALDVEALRILTGEQPEPVIEQPEPEVEVEPTQRVPGTRVVRNDMHRDGKPSVVPRWMQFAGGNGANESVPEGSSPVSGPLSVDDPAKVPSQASFEDEAPGEGKIGQSAPVPDVVGIGTSGDGVRPREPEPVDRRPSGESVPRWTKFRASAPASPNAAPEPTDLEQRVLGRLNAVQRAWFINHLFGSDRTHWKIVIDLLADADDWNEASEIIATEVFERHGVDIYSRPAVDFTNAVEARFR